MYSFSVLRLGLGLALGSTIALPAAPLSPEIADRLGRAVQAGMEQRHIPGLAVALVHEGEVIWTGCYGMADLENEIPVGPRTVFRFASVTKAMTAVQTMRLIEAGRLTLETAVSSVLPPGEGVPDAPITVRHLLCHQSGLRHYQPRVDREPLVHYNRLADALRAKSADAPLAAPGAKFNYTTHGYMALGRVLEVASGLDYAELMRTDLFAVAGMATAQVEDIYRLIPHRAQGYFRSLSGEWRNSAPADLSDKVAGGGLCGTIGDLAAFAAAVQGPGLLTAGSKTLMWTPQKLAAGTETAYGLGWNIGRWRERREIYHTGSQPKTSSLVWLLPDDTLAIVILGNLEQVNFMSLAQQLGGIALESGQGTTP